MPRESEEQIVAKMVIDEQQRAAKYAAATLGPAPDLDTVSGQREQQMWEFKDPGVDPMALYQEVSAMPPPEDIDPIKDPAKYEDWKKTEFTKRLYPYREVMLKAAGAEDEPDKRIAYAKAMKRFSADIERFQGGTANALPQPAAEPTPMEGY